jgi:hypothetical protein
MHWYYKTSNSNSNQFNASLCSFQCELKRTWFLAHAFVLFWLWSLTTKGLLHLNWIWTTQWLKSVLLTLTWSGICFVFKNTPTHFFYTNCFEFQLRFPIFHSVKRTKLFETISTHETTQSSAKKTPEWFQKQIGTHKTNTRQRQGPEPFISPYAVTERCTLYIEN